MVRNVNIGTFLKTLIKVQYKWAPNTHFSGTDALTILKEYLSVFKCELKLLKRLAKKLIRLVLEKNHKS